VLVVTQLAAGGLNVLLLAPVWMQLLHLLLADSLWIVVVLFAAVTLAEERVVKEVALSPRPAGD
jgi:heme A synthase